MTSWLLAHGWQMGLALLFVAAMAFPVFASAAARWLLGTETGRYVLATTIVVCALLWYREARFSAGYSAAVAEQKAAAEGARADEEHKARAVESEHALAMWRVGVKYEEDKANAEAQYQRDLADLRTGQLRLRKHWACPVPGASAATGERDGDADLREADAAAALRIVRAADAQVRAAQAVIIEDRK